jgi:hypothetical protein
MPFTTYEKIKDFVKPSIRKKLNEDAPDGSGKFFDKFSEQCDIEINTRTNRDIPTSAADSPAWLHYPAAMIIQFYCKNLIENASPEFIKDITDDYKRSCDLLALKIVDTSGAVSDTPADLSNSFSGSIVGLNSW